MVRAFAHGAMGRRIDPSWSGPIELFLVPASATRLVYIYIYHNVLSTFLNPVIYILSDNVFLTTGVTKVVVCVILSVG